MWKVEVKLDEEKIRTKSEYNLDDMYAVIDKAFIENARMERHFTEPDGTRIYIAPQPKNNDHYSMVLLAITKCVKQKWFVDNALKFLYGNSHGSDNPADFSREDILEAWKVGKSAMV